MTCASNLYSAATPEVIAHRQIGRTKAEHPSEVTNEKEF